MLSFDVNQFGNFSESGFRSSGFSTWKDFFSYFPVFDKVFRLFPSLNSLRGILFFYFYFFIFIENSPGNKHFRLASQSLIISYFFNYFMIGHPIKSSDRRLWEYYPFYALDFNWSSN